jgi:hypothetical protein
MAEARYIPGTGYVAHPLDRAGGFVNVTQGTLTPVAHSAFDDEPRTYGIGNAPRPKVGERIRVPYRGKIVRATVTALRGDRVEVTLDGEVREVRTSVRITATPEAPAPFTPGASEWLCHDEVVRVTATPEPCECGTGNDAIGPGHSDWCRRYRP